MSNRKPQMAPYMSSNIRQDATKSKMSEVWCRLTPLLPKHQGQLAVHVEITHRYSGRRANIVTTRLPHRCNHTEHKDMFILNHDIISCQWSRGYMAWWSLCVVLCTPSLRCSHTVDIHHMPGGIVWKNSSTICPEGSFDKIRYLTDIHPCRPE